MSVVDEIKERVDLVELISRYTPLKKAGTTYKGNCPFHNERTPSFVVWPGESRYYCFGACGEGGDAFTFLMKKENLEFREALELLAQQTGVELDQIQDDPNRRRRARMYESNQAAAEHFQSLLRTHPAAAAARAYLERRQIDEQTAEQFQLGFALDAWSNLSDHLRERGFSIEEMLDAGLLKQNAERTSSYDAFRGRLIIPIRDRQKRVIGFGGRVLDDSVPKYLNTAETLLFHKSRVVYGLDHAYRTIADEDRVVIVEGYMDVIAAHQHGYANVVACMGTAVTPDQLKQLERYTRNYVLALDADAAGKQATLRALNQAREALTRESKPRFGAGGRLQMEQRLGANLFITSMPPGRDPDDVIRNDPEDWQRLVAEAPTLVDFYFSVVSSQLDLESAAGKNLAVSELAALIAELGDDIERQHYVQELSRLVRIDERTIEERVQRAAKTIRARDKSKRNRAQRPASDSPPAKKPDFDSPTGVLEEPPPYFDSDEYDPGHPGLGEIGIDGYGDIQHRQSPAPSSSANKHEDHLLASLLQVPDLLVWLAGATDQLEIRPLTTVYLKQVEDQAILRQLKGFISSDEIWDTDSFQSELSEHLHGRYAELMAYGALLPDTTIDALREDLVKTLLRIRSQQLQEEITNIRYLLDEAQRSGDSDTMRTYGARFDQNVRELSHLQRVQPRIGQLLFDRGRQQNAMKVR